jgi:hypothetical protein
LKGNCDDRNGDECDQRSFRDGDEVSGGFFGLVFRSENQEQLQALKTFKAALAAPRVFNVKT